MGKGQEGDLDLEQMGIVPKLETCAICAPGDWENLGDEVTVELLSGQRKRIPIYPDRNVPVGNIHVVYKGEYQGCFEFESVLN